MKLADLRRKPYEDVRRHIRDGDTLLFRPRDWVGWLISIGSLLPRAWVAAFGGRTLPNHCHAAKAIWWGDSLWVVQQTRNPYEHFQRLSLLVQQYPGKIDVYTLRAAYSKALQRRVMVESQKDFCLKPYGWRNLLLVIPRHIPLVRRLFPTEGEATQSKWPPFCSMAVVLADRAGGVDSAPGLAARLVEPEDLAQSPVYRYAYTLE